MQGKLQVKCESLFGGAKTGGPGQVAYAKRKKWVLLDLVVAKLSTAS